MARPATTTERDGRAGYAWAVLLLVLASFSVYGFVAAHDAARTVDAAVAPSTMSPIVYGSATPLSRAMQAESTATPAAKPTPARSLPASQASPTASGNAGPGE